MNVLKKINQKGWQIIYFSAKKEVKDALSQDIANGKVHFVEINNS